MLQLTLYQEALTDTDTDRNNSKEFLDLSQSRKGNKITEQQVTVIFDL